MLRSNRPGRVLSGFLIAIGMATILSPLYLVIVTSLKTQRESTLNFFSLPAVPYLGNFRSVLGRAQFWQFLLNSTMISVVSVSLILLLVPMASYAMARNGKKPYYSVLYAFIVGGIFIPFQVIMLPISVMMTRLHLNNIVGVILFYVGVSFMKGAFLLTKYIRTAVPIELEEAAFMDGASVAFTYFRIVVPLIKPMISTIMIMDFLWIWNDFMLPLILLNRSPASWTLPLFQYNFQTQYTFEYNLAFVAILLSMIPVILLYAVAQKYIISGLTAGSVKG
jgi:raffinose/stachyose/melibiose transport system permease protein